MAGGDDGGLLRRGLLIHLVVASRRLIEMGGRDGTG
jgi:hypothetical protein